MSAMTRLSDVDGAVDARDRLLAAGLLLHQLGDVLEREPDGVDRLDDPVVEVLADPLALLDDREALDLVVEARVLDRDPGVDREHLDEALVVVGERLVARLVGEVQVADGPALHETGAPRNECITGWLGGKP